MEEIKFYFQHHPRCAYLLQVVIFKNQLRALMQVCLFLLGWRQKDNAEIAHREQELGKCKLAQQ
jgi:hypothetical protein